MHQLNKNCSRLLNTAAVVSCVITAQNTALGSTGVKYCQQRQQLHCDRHTSYGALKNEAGASSGRVIELRGRVGGMAATSDGFTIMLNLADAHGSDNSVTLEIPPSEVGVVKETSTAELRVLVKVTEGGSGNVVPLKVLAVAHESEVSQLERQAAQREAAQNTNRPSAMPYASRGTTPSRGNYLRPMPITPDVESLIAYYEPQLGSRVKTLFKPYLAFIRSSNHRLGTAAAAQITSGLLYFSDKYNVDPRLVVSMIIAESNFDPNSHSHSGAMGLGQLMPGTAKSLGVSNAFDPIQNLDGSINYLRSRLTTFGDVALAMAAYNAGAGAVKKYRGVPPYRETQAYVRRVVSLFQQLCQND